MQRGAETAWRKVPTMPPSVEGPTLLVLGLDCLGGTPFLDLKPDRSFLPGV
ncbi:hypothetical protein [Ensifer sp. LC499]|uniref:hypothetical protein n=1 Tax=Ensifer sp. LC499 TaxID=1120654 RepID=UPI0026996C4F